MIRIVTILLLVSNAWASCAGNVANPAPATCTGAECKAMAQAACLADDDMSSCAQSGLKPTCYTWDCSNVSPCTAVCTDCKCHSGGQTPGDVPDGPPIDLSSL